MKAGDYMGYNKQDAKMTKGLAIIFMVIIHLFQRLDNLPYTPLLYIGEAPFIYYLGLISDTTVPIYCFCMGYAHFMSAERNNSGYFKNTLKRLLSFMINFWIIVILISIAGFAIGSYAVPKSPLIFLGNFSTILTTYNGAWWFVKTYILLVLLLPLLYRLAKKCHWSILVSTLLVVYTASYYIRFGSIQETILQINAPVQWAINVLACLGSSLLPYMIGMIFCRHDLFTKIKDKIKVNKFVSFLIFTIIFTACFVAHSIFKTAYVTVYLAIPIAVGFNFWQKPRFVIAIFDFLGEHSTNIWLTHMFFYLHPFDDLVFVAKYPILILLLMLAITIACSYVLKLINKPFDKLLAKAKNS
ncbi:MAG: acyltransferase family protein [Clostridia bacterium]|nr:acyltransferase family protein [Clostridia bacterium]